MLGLAIYENIDKEGDVLMFYSIVDVFGSIRQLSIRVFATLVRQARTIIWHEI